MPIYAAALTQEGHDPMREGGMNPPVVVIVRRILTFLQCGMSVVAVFDGPIRYEKWERLYRAKHGGAPPPPEARRDFPAASSSGNLGGVKGVYDALVSMGVTVYIAAGDGEATCSELNAQGAVDAVLSPDGDCFAFGALCVLR